MEPTIPDGRAPVRHTGAMATYDGYCVKCREKREFEGSVVELANGSNAAQGPCPVCGTKMNRMLGNKAAAAK
jgi:hypothetical protein